MQDVGVQFAQSSGETVPAQVLPAELTAEHTDGSETKRRGCCEFQKLLCTVKAAAAVSPVAQLLGQVDVQDVRQDGGELRDIAQSGADGVGGVDVVQLCKHNHR